MNSIKEYFVNIILNLNLLLFISINNKLIQNTLTKILTKIRRKTHQICDFFGRKISQIELFKK